MKKKLILTLAMLLGCAGLAKADVLANTKYFPDEKFLGWVLNHFNKVRGEKFTDEELASLKSFDTTKDILLLNGVKSLKGIEYFTDLESVYIFNGYVYFNNVKTNIEEVDLSKNKKLKSFYFSTTESYYGDPNVGGTDNPYNPFYGYSTKAKATRAASASTSDLVRLKRVNLANLPELKDVDIECHALSGLDLRGCPNLREVIVHDSENAVDIKLDTCENLETFVYSKCSAGVELPDFALMPNLRALVCDDGKITKLDLSGVVKSLEVLSCSDNLMISLDLSKCTKLKSLRCEGLPLTTLDCGQLDSLKSIDVANCASLQSFPTLPSGITTIMCDNVKAFANVDLSQYTNLMYLHAENCGLTKFDITKYPNLQSLIWLSFNNNNIAAPNLSGMHYVYKYGENYKGYKINEQTVHVWAIPVPGLDDYWRLLLPDDVDLRKVKSYDFVDSGWREYKLYKEYYEDKQGNLKPSFVTNLPYVENILKGCVKYSYDTGGTYTIYEHQKDADINSSVTVYAKCDASGIDDVVASKAVASRCYYNMGGVRFAEKPTAAGVYVEQTVYTDGTTSAQKVLVK